MYKILIISISFIILFPSVSLSQQEGQFSPNMYLNMPYNPAFAGSKTNICVDGVFRQQWTGLQDADGYNIAPQTYMFNLNLPLLRQNSGLGLTVGSDKLGYEENTEIRLSYAYHIYVSGGILGIGAQFNLKEKAFDFTKFNPADINDASLISKSGKSSITTDYAFGLLYQIPGKFYIGLSATQLSEAEMDFSGSSRIKLKRHYFLSSKYEYQMENPNWQFIPSILIKSTLSSTQYDIAGRLKYKKTFYGGLGCRVNDAAIVYAGFEKSRFLFGYSYDILTSRLGYKNGKSYGSHELFLRHCIKRKEPKKKGTFYGHIQYL